MAVGFADHMWLKDILRVGRVPRGHKGQPCHITARGLRPREVSGLA